VTRGWTLSPPHPHSFIPTPSPHTSYHPHPIPITLTITTPFPYHSFLLRPHTPHPHPTPHHHPTPHPHPILIPLISTSSPFPLSHSRMSAPSQVPTHTHATDVVVGRRYLQWLFWCNINLSGRSTAVVLEIHRLQLCVLWLFVCFNLNTRFTVWNLYVCHIPSSHTYPCVVVGRVIFSRRYLQWLF